FRPGVTAVLLEKPDHNVGVIRGAINAAQMDNGAAIGRLSKRRTISPTIIGRVVNLPHALIHDAEKGGGLMRGRKTTGGDKLRNPRVPIMEDDQLGGRGRKIAIIDAHAFGDP